MTTKAASAITLKDYQPVHTDAGQLLEKADV
jgi:hypothetical protein